jgi:4-amino-4-deoxy-L-arabinose transferase-like glycosyltransferase
LGISIGGVGVASPIIAQNVVFVPLLALGCYQVGRLAFGELAGLLAVVFTLGSPLIAAQFHVFMIDAPETAMVAVSVWLILASERFSRLGVCALAGLAVGLGMLAKEPFVFFVAGPLAVTVLRGGWRAWRGLLAFALVALAVALPWYAHEFSRVHELGSGAINAANGPGYQRDIAPARWSIDNFEWYFWSFLNFQLYLPLFVFAATGWLWTIVQIVRRRPVSRLALELAVGAFVAWFAITETFVHDTRYGMPLLVYMAVFGGGWIARLPRTGRIAAATALLLIATVNTLGVSFGVGKSLNFRLPGANAASLQTPGFITLYTKGGFLVAGPQRDGDMLATLQGLRRNGVRAIVLERAFLFEPDFSGAGLEALAHIAGLEAVYPSTVSGSLSTQDAVFRHAPIEPGEAPPCVTLSDGTGVWIRLGSPNVRGARDYCPSRRPEFYGP